MTNNIDFILKTGLQVPGNVAIGTYATVNAAPQGGMIVSGHVGIGTATATNALVVSGNVQISNTGSLAGIYFSDGSFQSSAAAGTAVGGSSGSIQYNNSGSLGGNNSLVWDNTNVSLGIGTSLPVNNTLAVYGTTPAFFDTGGATPQILIGPSKVTNSAVLGYTFPTGYLSTQGGTTAITWNSSGYVNLGSSSSAANPLDVSGGAAIGSGAGYAGTALAAGMGLVVQNQVGIGTTATTSNAELEVALSNAYTGATTLVLRQNNNGSGNFVDMRASLAAGGATRFSINNVGNVTTGGWNGTTINANYGGTGLTSYAAGDLLYSAAANPSGLSRLAAGGTNNVLIITGGVPTWGSVSLTAGVTGILPLANGGTNTALTAVNGGILYGTSTGMAFSPVANLTYNAQNGFVGIGSSLPAAALDVNGNAYVRNGLAVPAGGFSVGGSAPSSFSGAVMVAGLTSNTTISAAGAVTVNSLTSNTAITVTTGGIAVTGASSITGNLTVNGNLILTGNSYVSQANILMVSDSMIYLADGNPGNTYDIGMIGSYNNGTNYYTGLVYNHANDYWTLFDTLTQQPNVTVNFGASSYGNFQAGNIKASGNVTSTSAATGTIIIPNSGGLGVGGNAWIGGTLNASGVTSIAQLYASSVSASGALQAASVSSNATISATGAISGANMSTAGSLWANAIQANTSVYTVTVYASGNLEGATVTSNGAISGANMSTAGTVWANAVQANTAIYGANTFTSGTVTGNVIVANLAISTPGPISANAIQANTTIYTPSVVASTALTGNIVVANLAISTAGTLSANAIQANAAIFAGSTVSAVGNINGATLTSNGAISGASISSSGSAAANTITANAAIYSGNTITAVGTITGNVLNANTSVTVSNVGIWTGNTATTSTTGLISVDSFSALAYRTMHYLTQITDTSTNPYSIHSNQIVLIHDGVSAVYKTEFNEIYNVQQLGTWDANYTSNIVSLTFTATSATAKQIKVMRSGIQT